jgi:hypothetical protein
VKKLLLFVFLGTMVLALPGMASPLACPATGTVASLIALNPTGCLIDGLLFDNFVFGSSATGTGIDPTASQVSYTLDDPGVSTGTGQQIWGFEFDPDISVAGIGSEDVSLDYDIYAPSAEITSLHVLENAGASGAGSSATVTEGPDRACTGLGTGCIFLPNIYATTSSPHVDDLGIGPYQEIDVFKNINVTSTTAGGNASISQVRDSVDLNYAPEPATFGLLGGALIGLSMLRRKKAKPE